MTPSVSLVRCRNAIAVQQQMDTTAIRRALVALDYSLAVEGCVGPGPRTALNFPAQCGLAADGVSGPSTVEALQTALEKGDAIQQEALGWLVRWQGRLRRRARNSFFHFACLRRRD